MMLEGISLLLLSKVEPIFVCVKVRKVMLQPDD